MSNKDQLNLLLVTHPLTNQLMTIHTHLLGQFVRIDYYYTIFLDTNQS